MEIINTQDMRLFVPITKIDEEKRLVYGLLAEEAVDKSGEIFDYETSKQYVKEWSDSFKAATSKTGQEQSAGNLRVMHTNKVAGKFVSVDLNDAAKNVPVCAYVADSEEWDRTKKGVYTGFSIGGRYLKTWDDAETGKKRYTASLIEGSLVDNPCMYGATFTAIKNGGAEELRKFGPQPITWTRALLKNEIEARRIFANPTDADAIVTKLNAGELTVLSGWLIPKAGIVGELEKIAARSDTKPIEEVSKSLWHVGRLSSLVADLKDMAECMNSESYWEGDPVDGEIATEIRALAGSLGALLVKLTQHEVNELAGTGEEGVLMQAEMLAALEDVKKVISEDLKKSISEIKFDGAVVTEAIEKALLPGSEKLAKVETALTEMSKAFDARLKVIEAHPAAAGRTVAPAEKTIGAATVPVETPFDMNKAIEALEKTGVLSEKARAEVRIAATEASLKGSR